MRKLQFGSRLAGVLRFMEINGYEVCGLRMLGRRWECSGVLVTVVSYVSAVRMLAQYFLV